MPTLRWPEGRGVFIDRDTSRTPVDDILEVGPGDTVEVEDEDVAGHYQDRGFVPVDGDGDGSGGSDDGVESPEDLPDDAPSGTLPIDPSAYSVPDLEQRLADIEDREALRAVRGVEERNKNRTTAKEAIDSRLDEVSGGD